MEEQNSEIISQIKRETNPDRCVYTENVTKNSNGTLKQLRIKNKAVSLFGCPEAGDRCPVHILDQYLSRLPEEAFTNGIFIVRPLEKVPDNPSSSWFSTVLVGKHMHSQ